ncbi:MAG TPA: hypothetical protein VI685_06980 [Candidatus Angelobacter sp.]
MKRVPFVVLALLLVASLVTAQAVATPNDNTRPAGARIKGVNLSGTVSADGKKFRTEDDNDWNVTNGELLKGLEGRYVTIKCRIDPNHGSIHILSVTEPSAFKHAANLGDSAFRR